MLEIEPREHCPLSRSFGHHGQIGPRSLPAKLRLGTRSKIRTMTDEELKSLFDAMRQDTAAMLQENAATRQENAAAHEETRRHFDVAAERLEKRFGLLAESVAHLDDELQRTRTSLDEKIDRTAAETQAMIKFSHRDTTLNLREETL